MKALQGLEIEPSLIKYVFLTHHHDDHAGFAAELVEKTGGRIIAHQHALEPLARGRSEESMEPVNLRVRAIFSLFEIFHKDFSFPPVLVGEQDVVVERDDERLLRDIGIAGDILLTPGHCRDSMSILLDDGSAFVGDLAMNFLRFTGIKHRPIYIEDLDEVYRSWKKIIDRGARRIYPAHGRPFPAEDLVIKTPR